MQKKRDPFRQANQALVKALNHQWQRQDRHRQILRSQVGFGVKMTPSFSSCPRCANYHGKTYGMSANTRTVLVCAIHPFGWPQNSMCPDWSPQRSE